MREAGYFRGPKVAVGHRARLGGIASSVGLFFLAPLVGEFLLGNKPITTLPELILLAPMYGGGALLIREVARRTRKGWPTMVLLASAYGLWLEGPVDQMLFNPAYLGLDSFRGFGYVPGLDTGVSLIQATLTLHTVWSICVPIAIIEAFGRDRTRPWLGRIGLAIIGVVFVAGSVLLAAVQYLEFRFLASPAQLIVSVVAIVGLVVLAFTVGRRPAPRSNATAPKPWLVGVTAFGLSSLYWIGDLFLTGGALEWLSVGWWFLLAGASIVLLVRCSRRRDWSSAHILAVAGGALLTYVWEGFVHSWALGFPREVAVFGNAVFGAGAIILLAAAVRALKRRQKAETPSVPEIGSP